MLLGALRGRSALSITVVSVIAAAALLVRMQVLKSENVRARLAAVQRAIRVVAAPSADSVESQETASAIVCKPQQVCARSYSRRAAAVQLPGGAIARPHSLAISWQLQLRARRGGGTVAAAAVAAGGRRARSVHQCVGRVAECLPQVVALEAASHLHCEAWNSFADVDTFAL